MDGLVGGFGSGDRTFARRTCLADIVPDTPAAAAGIDPRARGTVEASRAADFGACGGTFFTRVDRQFVQRRTRFLSTFSVSHAPLTQRRASGVSFA